LTLPPKPSVSHESIRGDVLDQTCDCLVMGVATGALSAAGSQLDKRTSGWLSTAIATGVIKTSRGELTFMPAFPMGAGDASTSGAGAKTWMFVGVGDVHVLDPGKAFELGATIVRRLVDAPRARIVISMTDLVRADLNESLVAGAITGYEGQALYLSEPKINPPGAIVWHEIDANVIEAGKVVGESINLTRRLVNEPPNIIYPESFADAAAALASETGLSVEIWDEKRLEAEGCRAILAVGAGSVRPSRLVKLTHMGAGAGKPLLAIVGKGVTFDSGGLSIKPTDGMVDMKCDMAGAATVLGTMRAIAMLKLPVNVIGLCGLAENMISGTSYKLGDVIEARNGTTIEILNTDAEGRVVLADTLDVAVQHQPAAIVDMATLTGACMVALGRDVAGLMSNNASLCGEISASAKQVGELTWELPMFEMYDEQIKSKIADIKNTGDARWGGAITAAKFLQRFVHDRPWVHIDIAGPAYAESPKPSRDAGATGVMLRTLVAWLRSRTAG
jgi:leucyl aminopeptidase